MRISSTAARIATCGMVAGLVGGLCLALGPGRGGLTPEPAFAFDGTTSPSTAALSPSDGLRGGAHAPDTAKASALTALQYAAEQGQPVAQWKLGRMYADGDGVPRDDLRAFNYFSEIANTHPDETPGSPQASFVANAFVALGHYYLTGIANSPVAADPTRAGNLVPILPHRRVGRVRHGSVLSVDPHPRSPARAGIGTLSRERERGKGCTS